MPENAFAVTDKTDQLYADGFRRLLLDFSKTKVTKGQLREVTESIMKKAALPGISRFNWKEGFYSPQQIEEYKAGNERAAAERLAHKNGASRNGTGFRGRRDDRGGKGGYEKKPRGSAEKKPR
jgi:putative protease